MEAASDSGVSREDAKKFLEGLKAHLNERLPPLQEVRRRMQEIAADAKRRNPKLQDVSHEGLFLNEFILRPTHEYLTSALRPRPADACKAFLAESKSARREGISSGTPASALRHPFRKEFTDIKSVVKLWWKSSTKSPVSQSCPDLAFRFPCQYKVVFEGKYFRKGGLDAARTELVKAIYQCFYYRGLPTVPETKKHAAWGYDYACLLAYDASENCSLVRAWKTIDPRVEGACWNAANVFAIVLPLDV